MASSHRFWSNFSRCYAKQTFICQYYKILLQNEIHNAYMRIDILKLYKFCGKNDFNDKINRVKSFKIVLSGYQYVFSCFHEKMGLNYQYFSIKKG